MEKAELNTIMYWKKNNEFRTADSLVDLIEENQKSPKHRVFKKYKGPVPTAIDYNKLIRNVKKQTWETRENIRAK
jgi:hypothetical protein